MTGWQETRLDGFVDFKTGKLDSNRAVPNGKYPFFTCSPTTLAIDDYAFDEEAVLLAGNNANGVFPVKYYKGKFNAYQRTYIILPKNRKNTDVRWLYYLTQSFVRELQELSIGSATRFITKQILDSFTVRMPPPPEQRAIAAVLGALDDKIELNSRMNATLEAAARALFKSWFVDFDPVKAKMAGNQPFGMDAAAAALFPARLTESELGDIPDGWTVKPLDEIANFLNGLALQKYPQTGDDYLSVIKIAELRQGITNNSNRASLDMPKEYIVEDGDVLFSWSGSLMQVLWTGGRGALNQHLFKVTSNYPKWFHYYWVEQHMPWFRQVAASKATTMGHIQRMHLTQAKVLLPNDPVMQAADKIIAPLFQKKLEIGMENKSLERTRDYLLPKLISGEIRIPNAEKFVEGLV